MTIISSTTLQIGPVYEHSTCQVKEFGWGVSEGEEYFRLRTFCHLKGQCSGGGLLAQSKTTMLSTNTVQSSFSLSTPEQLTTEENNGDEAGEH